MNKQPPIPGHGGGFHHLAAVHSSPQGQPLSVLEAMGNVRGIVESNAPTVVFLLVYFTLKNLTFAAVASVAVALIAAIDRLARRQPLQHALGGGFLGWWCAVL